VRRNAADYLPGIPVVGLVETLPSVLAHIGRRRLRHLPRHSAPPAERAGDIPEVVVTGLHPRRWRLAHYLGLTDAEDLLPAARQWLPPIYPTAWGLRPYLRLLDDPHLDLGLAGVVHAQNDIIVHGPIAPQERLTLTVKVERLHRDDKRMLLVVRADFRVGDQCRAEMRSTLITGLSPAQAEGNGAAKSTAQDDSGKWRTIRVVDLGRAHALRYALFSGDVNPLHLHTLTSRPLGFDAPVLHGFCLKAILAHALIRSEGGGDMSALRRLRLRFRRAVTLPTRLEVQVNGPQVRVRPLGDGMAYAQGRYRIASA